MTPNALLDAGLLIARLVLGLTMAAHGYNKFFGPGGLSGTASWFDSLSMKPGMFHARLAATSEMAAGIGLAVGLLTPIPVAGFIALMLVAAWTVHRHNGFFIVKDGWEYNLVLGGMAVALAATGAGKYSLDYALFHGSALFNVVQGAWALLIALALGLIGGIGQLVIFYRAPAPTPSRESST